MSAGRGFGEVGKNIIPVNSLSVMRVTLSNTFLLTQNNHQEDECDRVAEKAEKASYPKSVDVQTTQTPVAYPD